MKAKPAPAMMRIAAAKASELPFDDPALARVSVAPLCMDSGTSSEVVVDSSSTLVVVVVLAGTTVMI